MKIDVWTHILTPSYRLFVEETGSSSFLLANRALHDLDNRLEALDPYEEYQQVLAPIPMPRVFGHGDDGHGSMVDLVRRNNEEMAEIVRRHPNRFVGFTAATPIADADAAAEEAVRAVRDLGALGVQLEEDAAELPLHEDRYDPLFAGMEELNAGVWLHPFRSPASPAYPREAAPFLLWQVFGWPFDTTITVSRLIFSGIYDRHPRLKLIVHHGGALIPQFSGRIELMPHVTRMDPTLGEALGRLRRPPIDYFKMLYVDTAMFGAPHAVQCVIDFFGPDHVLFGTDAPFDTRGGSYFIPATISDVESAVPDEADRAAVFEGNARELLGIGQEGRLDPLRG